MNTLHIKNMVCDRCKMAVRQTLQHVGLHALKVDLGEVTLEESPSPDQLAALREELEQIGFKLLDDRRQQTVDLVKSALIKRVLYQKETPVTTISDYLSQELHQDYSIERYFIELRIERVKELICYDELTLTQIALRMHYSSVAYLSSQFKSVTGLTPSQFTAAEGNRRKALDRL